MNQSERRNYLIEKLLEEQLQYAKMRIPEKSEDQKLLLRSLMNIRMPGKIDKEFQQIQDAYLAEENARRGNCHTGRDAGVIHRHLSLEGRYHQTADRSYRKCCQQRHDRMLSALS